MDDVLTETSSLEKAVRLQKQLIKLLAQISVTKVEIKWSQSA